MANIVTSSVFSWSDPATETILRNEVSSEISDLVVKKFSNLVRESGSPEEAEAAEYLASFLKKWGVQYQIYFPELYISRPRKAEVKLVKPFVREFRAKNPAMTALTGEAGITAELVYVESSYARNVNDLLNPSISGETANVRGKIVLTEGLPLPGKVGVFTNLGAASIIFISPGLNIHEGIVTTIWGSPDLDSDGQQPAIPVLSVNREDGEELKHLARTGGAEVNVITRAETGWYKCPVLVANIPGTEEPDKYVLLHGHLDSWHVGIGDNATGDAALLELTRIFHKHRQLLKRSLKIAWWPGHSYGRYAGSTWFADHFGFDLEQNCIAQVNCDSPGCRWATSYEYVDWMSEVDEFCQAAIFDAVGQRSKGTRPARAGDYSFNNIGITSFFMLSSSIPADVLKEKGYYAVGGCGGNIEWHTEDDGLQLYDPEIQVKDIKVYLTAVFRALNAPIHPYNFVNTVEKLLETIEKYQHTAGDRFDFGLAKKEGESLLRSLKQFNAKLEDLRGKPVSDPDVQIANRKLEKLGRILIRINYSRKGIFRHDPAVEIPPLPDIAEVNRIDKLARNSHEYKVLLNHLVRGTNRVAWAFKEAREVVER
jgi:N-acetylated-alpha-linked acidic dipeptidase